jgi:hypothetical protein
MPPITLELIRRKSEHNEGLIHTLEEISLHQEEIEKISDVLGSNCRRLKILYLQVRRTAVCSLVLQQLLNYALHAVALLILDRITSLGAWRTCNT